MLQLKDLLSDALRRGHIGREIAAVKITEAFDELVQENLPLSRKKDVFAISFKDGVLEAGCKNSMAMHWLTMREQDFLIALSHRMSEVSVKKIKAKIKYDF
ncbi:MAG: hypothetical protein WC702_00625 [Patescibacteria group bacterium]|jgi:hypothetical protein